MTQPSRKLLGLSFKWLTIGRCRTGRGDCESPKPPLASLPTKDSLVPSLFVLLIEASCPTCFPSVPIVSLSALFVWVFQQTSIGRCAYQLLKTLYLDFSLIFLQHLNRSIRTDLHQNQAQLYPATEIALSIASYRRHGLAAGADQAEWARGPPSS